jgi:DNA-binding transcriptional LysR family regulator
MATMRTVNLASLDLNLLRVFDAIYRERHLTRAGVRLCLTQPAMSHALARLRATFDDELFVRSTRGLEPTPRADQIATPIAEAIDAVQRALASVAHFEPQTARMRVRVGLTDYGSWVVLPRLGLSLERQAPGIDLETVHVNVESARDLLDRGQLDLAIVASGEHPPRFGSRLAMSERYVCVAAADHPEIGDTLTEEVFLSCSHVLVSPSSEQRSIVDRLLAARGKQRHVRLQVPFLMGVPRLVAHSRLLCTVPEHLAGELAAAHGLRTFELPFEGAVVDYHAVWHARDETSAANRWLRDQVLACCAAIARPEPAPRTIVVSVPFDPERAA